MATLIYTRRYKLHTRPTTHNAHIYYYYRYHQDIHSGFNRSELGTKNAVGQERSERVMVGRFPRSTVRPIGLERMNCESLNRSNYEILVFYGFKIY